MALIAEIGHHHLRDLTVSKFDRMDLIVCIAVYHSSSIFFLWLIFKKGINMRKVSIIYNTIDWWENDKTKAVQ